MLDDKTGRTPSDPHLRSSRKTQEPVTDPLKPTAETKDANDVVYCLLSGELMSGASEGAHLERDFHGGQWLQSIAILMNWSNENVNYQINKNLSKLDDKSKINIL